jgi:protein-S-isoprenylcysteine O-methyltransferase Ste14
MVGSWTVLALVAVRVVMNQFWILGEEETQAEKYGDFCLEFKESVPRYFIFF